jgi:hypothetical protein
VNYQGLQASGKVAEVRYSPVQPGKMSRLATIPVLCLSGKPKTDIRIRHVWIAALVSEVSYSPILGQISG